MSNLDPNENIMAWYLAQGGPLHTPRKRHKAPGRRTKARGNAPPCETCTPGEAGTAAPWERFSRVEGAIGRTIVFAWGGFVLGSFFALLLWLGWAWA